MGRPAKKRKTKLGQRLLAIRERYGMTQTEAAQKVGVTLDAWHAWEVGKTAPTKSHLLLIQLLEAGKL